MFNVIDVIDVIGWNNKLKVPSQGTDKIDGFKIADRGSSNCRHLPLILNQP